MESHFQKKQDDLLHQLAGIKQEILALQREAQDAALLELEKTANSLEDELGSLATAVIGSEASVAFEVSDPSFSTWWKEEVRKGIRYASVTDAATAYEAAGYRWLED